MTARTIEEQETQQGTLRRCRACKLLQPRTESFRKQSGRCGGFHTQCKTCDKRKRPQSAQQRAKASARYYEKNKGRIAETVRAWRVANHDAVLSYNKTKRAQKASATLQDVTAQMLRARAEVFGNACAYCGGAHEHWDHVIPLARGGKHCLANLRPACARCNLSKNAKRLHEWAPPQR